MRRILLGTLLIAALATVPAAAQEQRCTIEGDVRDAQGGVLPGSTVEARNLAQGGSVSTVTDGSGVFRFPALSAGYYSITASLAGFRPARVDQVEVLLGQIKRLSFTLDVAGLVAEVTVPASPPLVDVRQSARGFSLRQDTIDLLPKGTDFSTLVAQAPSANLEPKLGGISIDGSSASENRFIIDGVETTDLVSGVSGKNLLPNFVDEIQVKSSGYTAEYGGSTGGVINVVTRSGTNDWHGDARASFQGSAFEGGRRPTLRKVPTDSSRAEYVTYPEDHSTRVDPGLAIGGPIKRDRAWLFAAYQPALTHTARTVTFTFDQSTAKKTADVTEHFFSGNHTAQFDDDLRTRVAFNASPSRQDGFLPALDGSTYPQGNFDIIDRRQNYTVSGSADWVATPTLYLGARAGYFLTNHTNANVAERPLFIFQTSNIGYLDVPPALQQVVGFRTDLSNDVSRVDRLSRVNAQADGTYYGKFFGQHMLKAGVQLDRRANDVDRGASANVVNIYWNTGFLGQRGRYGHYRVRSNPVDPKRGTITTGTVSDTTVGLFVQDGWTVHDRLTVDAGLRTENETVPFYNPTAAGGIAPIHFSFRDKLAPRVSAAWDVAGDGRWKIHGSWGVFYDIFKLTLPQSGFGGLKQSFHFFTLDTYDWPTLVTSPACPPTCPGVAIVPALDYQGAFDNIEPALDPMRLQEATIGVEHQLAPHVAIAARYVHKQLDKAVEDVGSVSPTGQPISLIGNPGYHQSTEAYPGVPYPKAVRDYDAVEIVARKLLDRRWAVTGSYVWSRLHGNYSGLSESDEDGRTAPNIGADFDDPIQMFGDYGKPVYGRLATDRPHQVKAQFVYAAPAGLSIGLFESVSSGVPVSRYASVDVLVGRVFYAGRGSDGRTPVLSQTDLSVLYAIKLGTRRRVMLGLNVLNLFNQGRGTSRFSSENYTPGGDDVVVDRDEFYAGRIAIGPLFDQQHVTRDPRFLRFDDFQAPIRARIEVRFSF